MPNSPDLGAEDDNTSKIGELTQSIGQSALNNDVARI